MRLTGGQTNILHALASGFHLKSHRYLDGTKVSRLHSANGEAVFTVAAKDIERLENLGLIAGNMKFPAATYLLTENGARFATSLGQTTDKPLSARLPRTRYSPS
jgi:hypothetical protein